MIQELLGNTSAGLVGGERNISIGAGVLEGSSPSLSSSSSTTTTATTTTSTTTTTTSSGSSEHQNVRCPRCDSSNTKFCYYNNYNLTQPRHFCKTCRRYWTKGGALRNVPIGGGCRKSKNTSMSTASAAKSSMGKVKVASEIVKSSLGSGFDHDPPSNPILWATPQNSQLLALLRASQNLNPNPNPNPICNPVTIKDEAGIIGSHVTSDSSAVTGAINARVLNLDPLTQVPIGLCSSFWRNNLHQTHHHHHHQSHQQQHTLLLGEVQNSGIQDLYQRLRQSVNYYDNSASVQSNVAAVAAPSSSSSSIIEPAPVAGGELGYWNAAFSWSDLSTTNGAFP
ncbi:PREDICTED: dof zinc finger protein DOF5.7-like [Nelumbo nucifera]|uniref:Dof zinc finger protein n=2 Tax=Nelumbo nucifera TaxID=4432 RepID=A0A822ZQS4_NELNU|nr:PREDICTED: dof zinc finger protein DOF5.7-like [Nelumbo nucifera]DAD46850.1 TPA_asm: hypothetical protein HUJ06_016787 [Nelumbo nucifera]